MELIVDEKKDGLVYVTVSGGIKQKQLNDMDQHLRSAIGEDVYNQKVLVDLSQNDYIDSTGISWLLICHKHFKESGGRMVLHSIPRIVEDVLKILKLELVFHIAPDKDSGTVLATQELPDDDDQTEEADN